jgi:hypothetical protein
MPDIDHTAPVESAGTCLSQMARVPWTYHPVNPDGSPWRLTMTQAPRWRVECSGCGEAFHTDRGPVTPCPCGDPWCADEAHRA